LNFEELERKIKDIQDATILQGAKKRDPVAVSRQTNN